uniref:Uncharacterized protein n=1 Tax=Rhizophora mucronata TaxID=61149 RepID=A0A2P2QTG4_RHIMU
MPMKLKVGKCFNAISEDALMVSITICCRLKYASSERQAFGCNPGFKIETSLSN